MNDLTNGSLDRKPLRVSSACTVERSHCKKKTKLINYDDSRKQDFTKYFFNEDKECQTPHVSANQMEFDDFLKSHRSSIEKEVTLIFQGSRVEPKQNLEKNKINCTDCEFSLKDLIKYAKKYQSVTPVSKIIPMSINKARLNAKTPVIPCNSYPLGLKKGRLFSTLSPKNYGFRLHNLAERNNYKSAKSAGLGCKKIPYKANRRTKNSKRPYLTEGVSFVVPC